VHGTRREGRDWLFSDMIIGQSCASSHEGLAVEIPGRNSWSQQFTPGAERVRCVAGSGWICPSGTNGAGRSNERFEAETVSRWGWVRRRHSTISGYTFLRSDGMQMAGS